MNLLYYEIFVLEGQYLYISAGTFDSFLAGLGKFTVYVAQPKWPINQFKPVQ